jgi:hypothetical protein
LNGIEIRLYQSKKDMKALLIFAVLSCFSVLGQTNIIAAKSHASNEVIVPRDMDNFGDPAPMRYIQNVEYMGGSCIIETYIYEWADSAIEIDTICDHPFLQEGQVDAERIKAMYPEGTKFIGFEKLNSDQGNATPAQPAAQLIKAKKVKRSKKSSAWWMLIAGGGLFMIYLFMPKKSLKTS